MRAAKFLPVLIGAAFVATAAFAAEPVQTVDSSKGKVLAAENGMTLYTFRNDKKNVSNCYGACAKNWPPLMAASNAKAAGVYSIVNRKDGTKQWAKGGMPLYFWAKDKKMGDVTGDGVGGVWDVAKP